MCTILCQQLSCVRATSTGDLTKSREEAYERLLAAKQEHTVAFERQLHAEVDAIREKNKTELEELRASSRQIYEQEVITPCQL